MVKPLAQTHSTLTHANATYRLTCKTKTHGHIFRRFIVRVDKVYVDFCNHNYSLFSPLHFYMFCLLTRSLVLGSGMEYCVFTTFSFFSRRKLLVFVFLAKQNENTNSLTHSLTPKANKRNCRIDLFENGMLVV